MSENSAISANHHVYFDPRTEVQATGIGSLIIPDAALAIIVIPTTFYPVDHLSHLHIHLPKCPQDWSSSYPTSTYQTEHRYLLLLLLL
jgi:hypothetical protein